MASQMLFIVFFIQAIAAQYSQWPSVSSDSLADIIGISVSCITALNETVTCDPTLFRRTKSVDYYFWTTDDVTTLCTSECQTSAESWNALVLEQCASDTMVYNGKAIPAYSVSERQFEGLNLVCMTSPAGESCMVNSQSWVGSGMLYNSDGSIADEQPLTQLYDNTTLCDPCFIDMFTARINSTYVPDSDFSDYLSQELGNIVDLCGGNSSEFWFNGPTSYPYATSNITSNTTTVVASSSSVSAAAASCTGQTVTVTNLKQRQLLSGTSAFNNVSQQCDDIALKYNVPTGSAIISTGNSDCNVTTSICLPPACDIQQIGADESTCSLLASQLVVAGDNVTTVQLLAWNGQIMGTCDDLLVGQYVCITPPGGAWTPAIANVTTNGTVGDSGQITQSYSSGALTATPTNGIATPTPIQTGMSTSCDVFHLVQINETCDSLVSEYTIGLDSFYAWNPSVGSTCEDLEVGIYVCVDVLGSSTVTTTTNTFSTPSPIQTGMATDCDEFYDVQSGDGCYDIASSFSIPLASFYAYNPAVSDCSALYPSYYVCVGVEASPTPTSTLAVTATTSAVVTPTPTQTGMATDCDAFYLVAANDECGTIATKYNITLADFYAWNTGVGSTCQYLELGVYVCVGVS